MGVKELIVTGVPPTVTNVICELFVMEVSSSLLTTPAAISSLPPVKGVTVMTISAFAQEQITVVAGSPEMEFAEHPVPELNVTAGEKTVVVLMFVPPPATAWSV